MGSGIGVVGVIAPALTLVAVLLFFPPGLSGQGAGGPGSAGPVSGTPAGAPTGVGEPAAVPPERVPSAAEESSSETPPLPAASGSASQPPARATAPLPAVAPGPATSPVLTPLQPEKPLPAAAPAQPSAETKAPPEVRDQLLAPGYVPGYRAYQGLSLSPYSPRVGGLPGGMTPAFAAPMPPGAWTFRFSGFMSATLQASTGRRALTSDGAPRTVFHVPPQVLDEYASFLGTTTMPGQWVAMNFATGNDRVTANVSLNTWSPSNPSTYYQIGSQYFVNNAYLAFDFPLTDKLRLRTLAGYFYSYYGNLGQYTPGMYTNTIIGSPHGVGETTSLEYSVGSSVVVELGHGIMGNRNGRVPDDVVATGGNGSANPIFAASWVNHLHLGLVRRGELTLKAHLHYLTNWAQDDRVQRCPGQPPVCVDDPTTRGINEAYVPDARIDVIGFDAGAQNSVWGSVAAGGVFIRGEHAFPLRGLTTFGGEGQTLTERWWGDATGGTGKLFAGGLNYTGTLRAMRKISGDGPDVTLNAGLVMAYTLVNTTTASGTTVPGPLPPGADVFNHKRRTKFGADVLYSFASFMGAAVRFDRVEPNSKDAGETFHVLASRLIFRTDWQSRGALTLLYAKWFYGPRSHSETGAVVSSDVGLDSQLVALNVNMWW